MLAKFGEEENGSNAVSFPSFVCVQLQPGADPLYYRPRYKDETATLSLDYLCHLDILTWRVLDPRRTVVVGGHHRLPLA